MYVKPCATPLFHKITNEGKALHKTRVGGGLLIKEVGPT